MGASIYRVRYEFFGGISWDAAELVSEFFERESKIYIGSEEEKQHAIEELKKRLKEASDEQKWAIEEAIEVIKNLELEVDYEIV